MRLELKLLPLLVLLYSVLLRLGHGQVMTPPDVSASFQAAGPGGSASLICNTTTTTSGNQDSSLFYQLPNGNVTELVNQTAVPLPSPVSPGTYHCILNTNGSLPGSSNDTFQLGPPSVTISPPNAELRVNIGSNLSLTCTATAFDAPSISWIPVADLMTLSGSETPIPGSREVQLVSMYSVSVTNTTGGIITCMANNTVGMQSKSVTIIVQGPPGAPTNLSTDMSSTPWTFTWRPGSSGNVLEPVDYTVVRRSNGEVSRTPVGTAPRYSLNKSTLAAFTSYDFTVIASNSVGNSTASNVVKIRTAEAVPSRPLNLTVMVMPPVDALVSWLPPAQPNGVITNYELRVCTIICTVYNTTNTWSNLQGLKAFVVYNVSVVAETTAGKGPPASPSVTFKTGQTAPSLPRNLVAGATGGTTVNVTWDVPSTPNGIVNYTVEFQAIQEPVSSTTAPPGCLQSGVRIFTAPSTQLDNLCYFTKYRISVGATSGGGSSDVSTTLSQTQQMAASAPRDLQATGKYSGETWNVTLTWKPPASQNGVFKEYTIEYTRLGQCGSSEGGTTALKRQSRVNSTTLPSLMPHSNYSFSVRSDNNISDGSVIRGNYSKPQSLCTGFSAPSSIVTPEGLKNGTTSSSLLFKLSRPNQNNGDISFCQVLAMEPNPSSATPTPDHSFQNALYDVTEYRDDTSAPSAHVAWVAAEFAFKHFPVQFTLGDPQALAKSISPRYNVPLRAATVYVVALRCFVNVNASIRVARRVQRDVSRVDTRVYDSFSSSSFSNMQKTNAMLKTSGLSGGAVAGIAIALILAASVVIGALLFIKYKQHVSGTAHMGNGTGGSVFAMTNPPALSRKDSKGDMEWLTPCALSVEEFSDHVHTLHANDNYFFSQEYEIITAKSPQPSYEVCGAPENRNKNRYANILCYDHSRVVLSQMREDDGDTTYINANYVDGYNAKNAYIATQGPVPDSIEDFWRMVWEENIHVVVMLTNLEERGRLKCHSYWPRAGSEKYGMFNIHHVESTALSDSTESTFSLEMRGTNRSREIRHFHYTTWPDHGVPDQPTPLLHFMKRVHAHVPPSSGPVVVHCSAGVGRTGTYIAIEAQLMRLKAEKTVDIYNFVSHIRTQRNFLVQTEAQYVFVHDAIMEAITTPITEVNVTDFKQHYAEVLSVDNPPDGAWNMKRQFDHLNEISQVDLLCKAGNEAVNKKKNRSQSHVPIEASRVKLRVVPGLVGSDYINASYVNGYIDRNAYIVTQGPITETINDFWRMVWEQSSHNIVMLTNLQDDGKEQSVLYWPDESKPTLYGDYLVSKETETTYGDVTVREFLVTCTKQEETVSRPLKHYQCTSWPAAGKPSGAADIIQMLGQIQKVQQATLNRPIIVHCGVGSGRTGVFCALSICLERVKSDGVLDVYQTVKAIRGHRPGLVSTQAQYQFIYEAILQYLDSFEMYSNFK